MPSTVVHLALAALLAASLLGDAFDARALAAVLLVAAVPDLDTFLGIAFPGTHRAALHTILVPLVAAGALAYDTRARDRSLVRRGGPRTVRIAWVALAAYVIAGVGLDLFANGVNLFYPLHDRFYAISGEVVLSDQRGLVQTLWQPARSVRGTTATTHYYTGFDPVRGPDPPGVERVFPIARGGLRVLLVVTAVAVSGVRLWESRER